MEIFDSIVEIFVFETGANLGVDHTGLDLIPILGFVDSLLDPVGIIFKLVFFVPFSWDCLSRTFNAHS